MPSIIDQLRWDYGWTTYIIFHHLNIIQYFLSLPFIRFYRFSWITCIIIAIKPRKLQLFIWFGDIYGLGWKRLSKISRSIWCKLLIFSLYASLKTRINSIHRLLHAWKHKILVQIFWSWWVWLTVFNIEWIVMLQLVISLSFNFFRKVLGSLFKYFLIFSLKLLFYSFVLMLCLRQILFSLF